MIEVLAPGKLVIVGEYAVLDGAGAIVAAVNRGVRCVRTEGAGIVTPGDDRFVRAALSGQPGHYTFSDWNPVDLPEKPGFGGSAAAVVAAVVAAGLPPETAYRVHAEVQGGGSGVDIFASLNGGVRRFPDGLAVACPQLTAVWSGRSASTGPRVRQYLAWPGRQAFVDASRGLIAAFEAEPIRVLRDAYALLCAMAQDAGLDYDTPAHARIAALANDHGGAAKPSGAGGGDVAVALFPEDEARRGFERACEAEGMRVIPVEVVGGAI